MKNEDRSYLDSVLAECQRIKLPPAPILPPAGPAHSSIYAIPVYRVNIVQDSVQVATQREVDTPSRAAEIAFTFLQGADREHLIVIAVDKENNMVGVNEVSVGSIHRTIAEPADIFKPVILLNAAAFILAHNHPSGTTKPSDIDIATFRNIRACGEMMKRPMLDAIIINSRGEFYSHIQAAPYEFNGRGA